MITGLLASSGNGIVYSNLFYCSFDFCAILLLTVVIFNYFFSKRSKNRYSAIYALMLILAEAATVCDALYLITKRVFQLPDVVHDTFCNLFYLAYLSTGILFLIYAISVVYEGVKIPKICYLFANLFFASGVCGVLLACVCSYGGIETLGKANARYVYEAIVNGTQVSALVMAMILTLTERKKLRLHHRLNVYAFLILNCAAALMQMNIDHCHVCGFALSVALLLLYVTLQRPEDEVDQVSGMFNSKTFSSRVTERLVAGKKFYVLAIELDNIGVINTTFGMHGGNQLIREVSKRVKAKLGKHTYLYRLGGVRFVIIFDTLEQFNEFEPAMHDVFAEAFPISGTKLRISAMACLLSFPDVCDKIADVDEIMRYYRSVAKSSDSVIVTTAEEIERSHRRQKVDYAIQKAIKGRTFKMYYQPIYCVKTDAINACEALIRLNDPDLGFIPPDEFIPIAEQTGKIVEVGRIVMEEVCRFLSEKRPQQYGIEFVDVNLSVIQCMHPEIIDDIDETLKKYGVPREMVNLEVTETAGAQSHAILQARLDELHNNGFTISLDDFGSGFSSVEYLINFPFDVVKLDKSLVWAYMSTKKYEPILHHYLPMLHGLGTKVVAEGIETPEMVETLKKLGCDYLQGYYYSRPIPEDEFIVYMQNSKKEVG